MSGLALGWGIVYNAAMGAKQREKIREKDITGLKYFDQLLPLFEPLREVGCQRDKAGNRDLHFDQYCLLLLLFLFNPIVTSLRSLQQASQLKKVQKSWAAAARHSDRSANRSPYSSLTCF